MAKSKEKSSGTGQKTLRSELDKWQSVVSKEKDIKDLEAKAASEDLEFKKFENHYFDAKKEMEEFFGHIENIHLEKNQEKKVDDFMDTLVELENLLKDKNYQLFKNKYDKFNDNLKLLYSEIGEKSKEKKEEPSDEDVAKLKATLDLEEKKPTKETQPVVAKTEKEDQEQRGWKQRRNSHGELWQKFVSLARAIKEVDRNERNRKLYEQYDESMSALKEYLDTARKTEYLKIFDTNINYFNAGFKNIMARLEPDIKEAFERGGVAPKKTKPAEEVKLMPAVSPAEPEVEITIDEQPMVVEKKAEPKKGWLARLKERGKNLKDAILHPEIKKVAGKVGYDTITSVLGIKLITDALYAIKGKGDLAEWWKGRKESKGSRDAIGEAYQSLLEYFEKNKKNKTLEESEKVEKRLAEFKKQVESSHISPEEKKALFDRLWVISMKHQEDTGVARKERNNEAQRTLDAYFQAKISGMKIARDALNFALTATGLSMLRGLAYAGASIAERAGKAKREYARKTFGASEKKAELKFVAKDVFVNSAIETARALSLRGEKKDAGVARKTIDFIKALGTVARGFGIYGVAVSGAELPSQSIDKLISQIKEQGVTGAVSDNFIQNTERVWHSYTHPTEIFAGHKEPQQPEIPNAPKHPPVVEREEVSVPTEAPAGMGMEQFAAEHKLSSEFSSSLQNLIKERPELNNKESIEHILNASQIGPDTHSHHGNILKGSIDTLDESGGERRQVIFEEILKAENGGPKAAADYLQSQHFSSQHLSHLSGYIRKGTPDEFLKFAEKYNEKDGKMVSGLFRAMQGRESTDLANAGLEVDAVGGKHAIDNHVHGKINYFGVENKTPILSGSGSVTVDQMGVRGAVTEISAPLPQEPHATYVEKTLATYKTSEAMPAMEPALVVASVEKIPLPEKTPSAPEPYTDAPINQFLKEHGSNQKDFFGTFQNMRGAMAARLEDSLIRTEGSDKFFQGKMDYLYGLQENYKSALEHGLKPSNADFQQIDKLLRAEDLYKNGKSKWVESLDKTIFSKDDNKVMELAFFPRQNPGLHPILTNNSHAVRVWDSAAKKDVFWYDENKIFNLDKKGDLVIKDIAVGKQVMKKEEVFREVRIK